MRYFYFLLVGLLIAGCNANKVEIAGNAPGLNGDVINIIDSAGTVVDSAVIHNDKYQLNTQALAAPGYYTFSLQVAGHPRDFEIYLENVKYTIDIPVKETDYLDIKTTSKKQNDLSAYCIFENNLINKYRHEEDELNAKIASPDSRKLSDIEFNKLLLQQNTIQAKERGARLGIISTFIDKFPQNEVMGHIIAEADYKTNPLGYSVVYQKLSPAFKNSKEGKQLGAELQRLQGQKD